MRNIKTLVDKYDIDNGFKLLGNLDKNDTIDILTDKIKEILFNVAYKYDYDIDNGSNVEIGIEKDIKKCLEELFK